MSDVVTEQSGSILRVQLNRTAKKNATTFAMYIALATLLNAAALNAFIEKRPADFRKTRQAITNQ